MLYDNQPDERDDRFADKSRLLELAGKVPGLRTAAFTSCVHDGTHDAWVNKSDSAFDNAGFGSTPTVLLNGKNVYADRNHPLTPARLKQLVAAANQGKPAASASPGTASSAGTTKSESPGKSESPPRRRLPESPPPESPPSGSRPRGGRPSEGQPQPPHPPRPVSADPGRTPLTCADALGAGRLTDLSPGGLRRPAPGRVASVPPWTSHTFPAPRTGRHPPRPDPAARIRLLHHHRRLRRRLARQPRWVARGGQKPAPSPTSPYGRCRSACVGGRLYHVITDYELYFGKGRDWVDAFKVWDGGLGIWGAIALGALGAWIGCRRRGIPLPAYADAVAPGVALAQAVGRWGNWFNQELYGGPTKLPWALKIDPAHRPDSSPDIGLYHPTFLYESLWCIGVALLVLWADRRFKLGHGRAFALYVAAYTVGRSWIEHLRVDPAHHILGMRLNDWTAILVFVCAVVGLRDLRAPPPGPRGERRAPGAGRCAARGGQERRAGHPGRSRRGRRGRRGRGAVHRDRTL